MASVQERLQLKRITLDKWSIREQLCLASAVSCSGDQNWMSVSRSLKVLCGANRPTDWFSQKSCAVQYGELLENAETPKRKKRSGIERDNQGTETPTEAILRKLTQERITELKKHIQQQQEEYAKITEEIRCVENGTADENQLRAIWSQIEKELEQKEQEQQKFAQWMKEREERKIEMQRAWRPSNFQQNSSGSSPTSHTKQSQTNLKNKHEDMDVDDSSAKQGTSPLLTSLLKSPSNTASTSTSSMISTVSTSTNVRVTAPTITNLLTGNTAPQTLLHSSQTTPTFHAIQNQPLTGPIPVEQPPQVVQSPSQAAPTLSMLLEGKNSTRTSTSSNSTDKEIITPVETKQENNPTEPEAMETEESQDSPSKEEEQQLMEVFNGLIPDNIEELADILTNNNAIILNPELLEEESILENVESLMDDHEDIDNKTEALDDEQKTNQFDSKNMTEPSDCSKIKDDVKEENDNALDPEFVPKIEDSSGGGIQDSIIIDESNDKTSIPDKNKSDVVEITDASDNASNEHVPVLELSSKEPEQIEVSDDSSDNTCLQSLKEHLHDGAKDKDISDTNLEQSIEEPVIGQDESLLNSPNKTSEKLDNSDAESRLGEIIFAVTTNDGKKDQLSSDISDIIEIHEVSSSNDSKTEIDKDELKITSDICLQDDKSNRDDESNKNNETLVTAEMKNTDEEKNIDDSIGEKDFKNDTDTTADRISGSTPITIIDTDDDSPIEVIKEDKVGKTKRDYSRKKTDISLEKKLEENPDDSRCNLSIRKLKERDGSESPLVDDENADSIPRTRRRYSSTPVIDSIPNSPASSDDREYKAWKKSILLVHNRLTTHKFSSIFLRPVTEEQAPNYKSIILRPMDLQTIKRNIESGATRSTIEFQRDVVLMCQNAIMYNKKDNNIHNMAKEMMNESVQIIESLMEGVKKDSDRSQLGSSVLKIRGRKSRFN